MKPEEKQRVIQWINEKCPNLKCECCGSQRWSLNEHIIAPVNLENGSLALGGSMTMTPQVILTCSNCGNTKYFNAVMIGLLQPSNPSEKK
jgi:hypothetical protein